MKSLSAIVTEVSMFQKSFNLLFSPAIISLNSHSIYIHTFRKLARVFCLEPIFLYNKGLAQNSHFCMLLKSLIEPTIKKFCYFCGLILLVLVITTLFSESQLGNMGRKSYHTFAQFKEDTFIIHTKNSQG